MSTRTWFSALFAGLLLVSSAFGESTSTKHHASSTSASKSKGSEKPEKGAEAAAETVEMFAAMKSGDIDVKLIARDSKGGNVLITNKTKKPLKIALPEAFAAVPVNAQFGGMGGMGGMGMGGMGGGGGFFNVGPEKVGKIKVNTVCLEHGKKDPNVRVPYTLIPIESFTDKAEVVQLCKMLGRGEIPQNSAQAAAWHLANGLSWGELASKIRIKHLDGSTELYFSPGEVDAASRIASESARRAAAEPAPKKTVSPGDKTAAVGNGN